MTAEQGLGELEVARELIRHASISGNPDTGALNAAEDFLRDLGFECERFLFSDKGSYPVDNLFASIGSGKHLCFLGHTDVVPAGAGWTQDPFKAEVVNGVLYGRGAVDMKAGIAAFLVACRRALRRRSEIGQISVLLTGDEEKEAVNGTCRVLDELQKRGVRFDGCLIGEPTSREWVGDEIKIGRRGSLTVEIEAIGVAGHVAYPQYAANPIPALLAILATLSSRHLDGGTDVFEASHLEVVDVTVENPLHNVIPAHARATVNLRFNDMHSFGELEHWIESVLQQVDCVEWRARYFREAEPFVVGHPPIVHALEDAIRSISGRECIRSTSGGTSDARFMKDHCPTVELGLLSMSAHKADENVTVSDIQRLALIYEAFLYRFFDVGWRSSNDSTLLPPPRIPH